MLCRFLLPQLFFLYYFCFCWNIQPSVVVVVALSLNHHHRQRMTMTTTKVKGVVNIAMSVDGFIAGKDGNVDWLNNQPTIEGEDFGFADFIKGVDVMVMGRNTFDTVVGFGESMWAYGDDMSIIVWTRNVDSVNIPDWIKTKYPKVQVKSYPSVQDLWSDLQQLEQQQQNNDGDGDGRKSHQEELTVYVDGGTTIQSFLKEGLIHRLNLSRVPILLGEGIPLFGTAAVEGMKQQNLKHISTKSYSNGFVVSVYDVVADDDEPGSSS